MDFESPGALDICVIKDVVIDTKRESGAFKHGAQGDCFVIEADDHKAGRATSVSGFV